MRQLDRPSFLGHEIFTDYVCSDSRIANLAVGVLMVLGGIGEFFLKYL